MCLLRVILCLAVLTGFSPRSAQAEEAEPSGYTEAVNLGIAEFEQRNFIEARAHFTRAHQLSANARTLRALGMVAFELRKYTESVAYLTQALTSRERPLDAEKRKLVETLLERARAYLAHITLVVRPAAEVVVDGAPTRIGAHSELVLEAGDHVIELNAPGYVSERRTLELSGGEHDTLRVDLRALEPEDPNRQASTTAPNKPGDARRVRILHPAVFWVGAGISAGLVAASIWSGVEFKKAADAFERKPTAHLAETGPKIQRRTNALIGSAAAMAVATAMVGFLFTDWRDRKTNSVAQAQRGHISAWVARDGGGISCLHHY